MGIKLYVANCTKQKVNFLYRLPEHPSSREQPLPIGAQILISGDLSQKDVDYIIEQHRLYGMIEANERPQQGFVGLCYSIGKPVPSSPMQSLIQHNTEVMTNTGRVMRQEAAIAFNEMAEKTVHDFGGEKDSVAELSVQITEQKTSSDDRREKLSEQTVVSRNAEPNDAPRRGRGRPARAA